MTKVTNFLDALIRCVDHAQQSDRDKLAEAFQALQEEDDRSRSFAICYSDLLENLSMELIPELTRLQDNAPRARLLAQAQGAAVQKDADRLYAMVVKLAGRLDNELIENLFPGEKS